MALGAGRPNPDAKINRASCPAAAAPFTPLGYSLLGRLAVREVDCQ